MAEKRRMYNYFSIMDYYLNIMNLECSMNLETYFGVSGLTISILYFVTKR